MNYLRISNNKFIAFRGSALTPFIYNREFNSDISEDYYKAFSDNQVINKSLATKILWSLCKTHDVEVLPYKLWKANIKYNFDKEWQLGVINEYLESIDIKDVKESNDNSVEQYIPSKKTARELSLNILVIGKKMGLTFDELNFFTMTDLVDFIDVYLGEKEPGVKKATQEDWDKL